MLQETRPTRLGAHGGNDREDSAMSSGVLNRAARGGDGEAAGHLDRWGRPAARKAEDAWDVAGAFSHFQVELPSRRWYVEAVDEGAAIH